MLRHAAAGRISVAHEARPLAAVAAAWSLAAGGAKRQVLVPLSRE